MKHILTAALIALAAPATAAPNYVGEAAALLRENLRDPYTVRDVERTAPFEANLPLVGKVIRVCFRLNARNAFGGYVGVTPHTIIFYPTGKVMLFPGDDHKCERGGWRPYPEFVR